jgi:uncharacterized protein YybS (DUF2232 family)
MLLLARHRRRRRQVVVGFVVRVWLLAVHVCELLEPRPEVVKIIEFLQSMIISSKTGGYVA